MKERYLYHSAWTAVVLSLSLQQVFCDVENPQWSKPEQSLSAQNNDWIPVQGKCPTCRINHDLDSQSTNEEIGKILSPPQSPPQVPNQQLQYTNKQPRILPFGPNYPQQNTPFINTDNKVVYQTQSNKLFAQEPQKAHFQYESTPLLKQPYSLLPQQSIPQSSQQTLAQRLPFSEPYQFVLPLKSIDNTTPKVSYQPKIRFPDNEPPKVIPNNKITAQNTDEIQLLYVPIETLQRERKVMKDLFHQNQYSPNPQDFIVPQYNVQYSAIPKQAEGQFYFPNFQAPPNYLQFNQPLLPQRPDSGYANITKNFLQPYFTVNGVNSAMPQPLPKQPELQYFIQPNLYSNQIKGPEQVFKTPLQVVQRPFPYNVVPNSVSTIGIVYTPTTPEVAQLTGYTTETAVYKDVPNGSRYHDFNFQYMANSPQPSASQSQQYVNNNKLPPFPHNMLATKIPPQVKPLEEDINYPAPHQPPLSFYMEKLHNRKINDILYLLKDAKTIPVLDTIETDPPQVFVGPSELLPPKGYIKFELPYLSSFDYNRIERMIDRLPFFVAPLNFKPPPGYSKIPFPAPHIGSVVLSNSTVLQQTLHDKPFDQKSKPITTVQPLSVSPELSTISPHLTSQINNLVDPASVIPNELTSFKSFIPDSPPAQHPVTFKPYEDKTKKPVLKSTFRTLSSTTEQPKQRNTNNGNRQRKPIYRGYPTTAESIKTLEPVTTTESLKFYSVPPTETVNYVEFSAKDKFNINNENENAFSSISPAPNTTYEATVSSETPPVDSTNTYDFTNFFSKFEPSLPVQNQRTPETYDSPKPSQGPKYYPSGTSSNLDTNQQHYSNPSQYSDRVNQSEPKSISTANFNFNDVKPLSQYNHFSEKETETQSNITDEIPTLQPTNSQANEQTTSDFNFWNQNQFYNVSPNAVEYFSSTVNDAELTSVTESTTQTKTTTTESNITLDQQNREYSSSIEYIEQPSTTIRPRHKQRIHPHRYHHVKQTTEKENAAADQYIAKSTEHSSTSISDNVYELTTTRHVDSISQSTDNVESTTRSEMKHRRRRPIRPHTTSSVVTPASDAPSSNTSRNFRTRTTRYPNGGATSTERYRVRRPHTSASYESTETLNSEWSNYNSASSSDAGAAFNEIPNPVHNHFHTDSNDKSSRPKYSSSDWLDQRQVSDLSTSTSTISVNKAENGGTGSSYWTPSIQSGDEYSTQSSTVPGNENVVDSKTDSAERKDTYKSEVKHPLFRRPVKTNYYEDVSSISSTAEYQEISYAEPNSFQSEKISEREKDDDKLIKNGNQSQKKAYDPQDEKVPGRRLGHWVRRIRKKRPQDVFETAESQNLGRITDNSLQSTDSKILSETDEKGEVKPSSTLIVTTSRANYDDVVITIQPTTEKSEDNTVLTTTSPPSTTITSSSTTTDIINNHDDYANLQHSYAKMLSDYLNSNDQSTSTPDHNNVSTERSFSYILGLSNNDDNRDNVISNSSSYSVHPTTENVITNADDVITIANNPLTNTESVVHSIAFEESAVTYAPNRVGTSTTTEISLETEICYRGKCAKTKKIKASDLLPVE